MADVRLTATNPEDSSVVPVACNAKGELLLEEPLAEFDGNVDGDLTVSGSASFAGDAVFGGNPAGGANIGAKVFAAGAGFMACRPLTNPGEILFTGYALGNDTPTVRINVDGSASFASDVVIGSRGKKWMIVESNGLAHLVEQTRAAEMQETTYPALRDIPGELTMVEQQLQKVLEKLRMIPEAGWEVWDGSDTN